MRVLLVVNKLVPLAIEKAEELMKRLEDRGLTSNMVYGSDIKLFTKHTKEDFSFMHDVDMIVTLGGDGTLLSSVQLSFEKKVPILGVNFGTLGFITTAPAEDLFLAVDAALKGELAAEERLALKATITSKDGESSQCMAFNEVSLTRGLYGKMIRFDTLINGEKLASTRADGIIISSPSGSTAYSLSAGGPIVSPDVSCMIVTSLAPHSLISRSYVASPKDKVGVVPSEEDSSECAIYVDGHSLGQCMSLEKIEIEVVEDAISLLKYSPTSFSAAAAGAFFGGTK